MSLPGLPGAGGAMGAGWYGAAFGLWLLAALSGLGARLPRPGTQRPLRSRAGGGGRTVPAVLVGGGSGLLLIAALIGGDGSLTLPRPWFLGDASFQLIADPLSRWFLAITGFVGMVAALFSPGYLVHLRRRISAGFFWAALAALMASMALVVLAANALVFLVAWEAMALASFALVAADHEQRSVRQAALLYLGATRIGTAFLMGGFLWAHQITHSWTFSTWWISGRPALGPALLILLGLATKAGCWPFHLWLPVAHPAAPAPVSAVMSGVMIKTAIYATVRLLVFGHLSAPVLGPILLALGAISAFWGVLFALLQRDLKRLLAYSSVENIGLIMMGLGISLIGRRLHLPLVAAIGLAAALFHTMSHALFKSLLFLGAGAVDAQTHVRDMERLGGLIHRMPWTGACFIAGSAAICALPPLNGFASEWLLYQSFLRMASTAASPGTRLIGLLLFGWLALVGALALACFVKVVGIVFLGQARSPQAAKAREVAPAMVGAQIILALACAALGLSAPRVLVVLSEIAGAVGPDAVRLAAVWTLPLTLLLLALIVTAAAIGMGAAAFGRRQPARRYITWECGFGELGPRTQYTATSFAQPIARMFGALYRYSLQVSIGGRDRRHFPETVSAELMYEPYLETRVYGPLMKLLQDTAGAFVIRLQAGSIHQYLLYMTVALALLLWLGYRS